MSSNFYVKNIQISTLYFMQIFRYFLSNYKNNSGQQILSSAVFLYDAKSDDGRCDPIDVTGDLPLDIFPLDLAMKDGDQRADRGGYQ